jgi:hypothetical protein
MPQYVVSTCFPENYDPSGVRKGAKVFPAVVAVREIFFMPASAED